jgi:hypothetical protein
VLLLPDFLAAIVYRNLIEPGLEFCGILQRRKVPAHGNKGLLGYFHSQIVVQKELEAEVVDPLVPQLHKLALCILIPLRRALKKGIRMHHGNVQYRFRMHYRSQILYYSANYDLKMNIGRE